MTAKLLASILGATLALAPSHKTQPGKKKAPAAPSSPRHWRSNFSSGTSAQPNQPVQISGDTFEINGRIRTATYRGHVKALRGDATLQCDELIAYYVRLQEVDRLECIGNAAAEQGELRARGERVDFDNATGQVVASGNPQAQQGETRFAGERFTLSLENRTLKGQDVHTLASSGDVPGSMPTDIVGKHFEGKGEKKTATWSGEVKVRRGTTRLSCDRLTAYYADDHSLHRAECTGNVEAFDRDKWAKGERADYDVPNGLITVTGHPEARQGRNHMVGDRFVVDLGRDTIRGEKVKSQIETPPKGAKRDP